METAYWGRHRLGFVLWSIYEFWYAWGKTHLQLEANAIRKIRAIIRHDTSLETCCWATIEVYWGSSLSLLDDQLCWSIGFLVVWLLGFLFARLLKVLPVSLEVKDKLIAHMRWWDTLRTRWSRLRASVPDSTTLAFQLIVISSHMPYNHQCYRGCTTLYICGHIDSSPST